MPLFEFYCERCEKKYEELCSSEQNTLQCPDCGKEAKKVFSLFRTGGPAGGGTASSGCGG